MIMFDHCVSGAPVHKRLKRLTTEVVVYYRSHCVQCCMAFKAFLFSWKPSSLSSTSSAERQCNNSFLVWTYPSERASKRIEEIPTY